MRESGERPALRDVLSGDAPAELAAVAPRTPKRRAPRRDDIPGDRGAAGPLPALGALIGVLGSYAFLAVGGAALVAGISAKMVSSAYARVHEEGTSFGLEAAFACVGGHPAVVAFWLGWLFVGTAIAYAVERVTRSMWLVIPVIVALGAAPMLVAPELLPDLLEASSFGLLERSSNALAATNLPERWWLLGLVLGFGWVGARRDDSLLMAAAVVTAFYTAWELDVARSGIWAVAVDQVFDSVAHALPADANESGTVAAFDRARMVMHVRALSDLLFLLGPIFVVRTLTNRSLGAIGSAEWREVRERG